MPHYLGGKLGRSSSFDLSRSHYHSTVFSLTFLFSLSLIAFREKKIGVDSRWLYLGIGSFSTLVHLCLLFSYFFFVLFSLSFSFSPSFLHPIPLSFNLYSSCFTLRHLLLLFSARNSLPNSPFHLREKERVTIYSADLPNSIYRKPLSSHTAVFTIYHHHRFTLFFSLRFLYTLWPRYLCAGPANKHMNARAFPHTHNLVSARSYVCILHTRQHGREDHLPAQTYYSAREHPPLLSGIVSSY